MNILNSVLDKLSKLDSAFHSLRDTLDNNGVLVWNLTSQEFDSSLEVSADTDVLSDSNFVF